MQLSDLKVIELASVLAGPAVGMFFAELGASVVKVENSTSGGDVTRTWRLASEGKQPAESAYYCSVNWGKQVLFADLRQPADRQAIYELVQQADIVISNYKSGDDQKLGVDYATLAALNPRLIYGQITAFGKDNPRLGYDLVLQAETGFMYMNGNPHQAPAKMPVALIDILAAHQLKEALLLALLQRHTTGKGAYVSVSLYDAAVASLANQATNWLIAANVPQPVGSLHPNIAPYGDMFATADHKMVVLAVGNDAQFERLCGIVQQPLLAQNPLFATNPMRVANRAALVQHLSAAIAQLSQATLLDACHASQVPAAALHSMPEVMTTDAAQRMLLTMQRSDGSTARLVRTVAFEWE